MLMRFYPFLFAKINWEWEWYMVLERSLVRDVSLMVHFSRLYAHETQKYFLVAYRWQKGEWFWDWIMDIMGGVSADQLPKFTVMLSQVVFSARSDKWEWELEMDGEFTVSSTLPFGSVATRWCRLVLIKVNVLLWHVLLDILPTRNNLDAKNIDFPSIICVACMSASEEVNHVFVSSDVANQIWIKVIKWLDLPFPLSSNILELLHWADSIRVNVEKRKVSEVIVLTTIWFIWRYRNNVIFNSLPMFRSALFENVVTIFFNGVLVDIVEIILISHCGFKIQ